MRPRVPSVAAAAVLVSALLGPSPIGPSQAAAAACASADVKPELGAVMVNQGIADYPVLVRGKQALVRLFLRLPTTCTTSSAISMVGASLQVERVGTAGDTAISGTTPVILSPTRTVSGKLTTSLNTDATWDPIFLLPGSLLAPAGETGQWRLKLTASLTWKVGSGSNVTGAPATLAAGPTNPFYQLVDKRTNAFRILVVPMGDARLGYANQFPAADQAALVNGIAAFGRMGPFPDGVNSLSDNAGGLRYTINPSLLDIGPGGLNAMTNGKWCGRSTNFSLIKGPLAAMLDQYNLANPLAPADRVLGVAGATVSDGASVGCDEGRGEVPSSGVAARVAWVRAIPDTSKVPSITGPLIAMEMLHTVGGCAYDASNPNRCLAGTYHSTLTEAETADRAYNLMTRGFVLADRTAMKLQSASAWNNNSTFYEKADYALLQCALGGQTTIGGVAIPGCDPNRLVGTASGVAAGPIFVLSGTTDEVGGSAPCAIPGRQAPGTKIVDSYFADLTGQPIPPLSDEDPGSPIRLIYRDNLGAVIRDLGVSTSKLTETHGDDAADPEGAHGISIITEFDSATQVVELVHRPAAGPDEILYCRTRTARPVVEGAVQVPDTGRLVFDSTRDGDPDIYSMDGSGGDIVQLTNEAPNDPPATDFEAEVSHDGTKIAFASDRDGDFEIFVMNIDGTGLTQITDNADYDASPTWSPTGDRIAYEHKAGAAPTSTSDEVNIYVTTLGPSPVATQLTEGQYDVTPAWRPNGEEIVFDRGHNNVWWVTADAPLVDDLLFDYTAMDPAWSPDGTELAIVFNGDISLLNWPDADTLISITNSLPVEARPTYSASGDYITFERTTAALGPEPARTDVYRINLFDLFDLENLTGGGTPTSPNAFEFVRRWGASGSGPGQFETPNDIAIAADGTILVADSSNSRIQRFDVDGTFLQEWGSYGTANGQFHGVLAIAVGPDGDIWATDGNDRLQRFDAAGSWLATYGGIPQSPLLGQFSLPIGVDVDPSGNVYVADSMNNRIEVRSSNGVFSAFAVPSPRFVDWHDGKLYVTVFDSLGGVAEIRTFTDTGVEIGPTMGQYGAGPGGITDPWGVEVGPDGLVHLIDGPGQLQLYDPRDGHFVVEAGNSGGANQQLSGPRGLAIKPDGSILIAETGYGGNPGGIKQWNAWEGLNTPGSWTPNAAAADEGSATTITDDYPDLTRASLFFQCAPDGEKFPIAVGLEPSQIDAASATFFAATDTSALCGDGTPTVTGVVSDGFWSAPIDADPGTASDPDPDIDAVPVISDPKPPSAAIAAPAPLVDENVTDETAVLPPTFLDTDTIALAGSGIDPEDGDLCVVDPEAAEPPPCNLAWRLTHGATEVIVGVGATLDLHPRDPAGGANPVPAPLEPFVTGGRWDAGSYQVELVATDSDQMTGVATASFVIEASPPDDLDAPTVTVTHVPDGLAGWNVTSPVSVAVHADDPSDVASLACTVDGSPVTPTPAPTLPAPSYDGTLSVAGAGVHTVACAATDGLANANDPPVTDTVRIDTSAPGVTVTHTPDGVVPWNKTSPVAVAVSANDAGSGLGAVGCTVGATPAALAPDPSAVLPAATYSGGLSIATEGTTVVTCTATDVAGNSLAPSVADTVKLDSVLPVNAVTSPASGGSYPAGSVPAVTCSTTDTGGSGVATSATGSFGGSYPSAGPATATCSGGSDAAGNAALPASISFTITPVVPSDSTPPTVTVTGVANGATYQRGSVPAAGCSTVDEVGGSGVKTYATLSGPTGGNANGVGSYTVTCSGGKDNADNLAAPVSATYKVVYAGVSGVQSPIDPTKTTDFSKSKTIPVKFQLGGDPVGGFLTTGWRIDIVGVNCTTKVWTGFVASVPSSSSPAIFRYDVAKDQYVYNADVRGFAVGACYRFRIALDDGPHTTLPTSPGATWTAPPTVFFSGVILLKK